MTFNKLLVAIPVLLALGACSPESVQQAEKEGADLVLTNGRVYTLRWGEPGRDGSLAGDAPTADGGWQPDAEAVAVKDGDIVFVGSTAEALRIKGEATRVVDLAGATVLPGLVDSHTHVFGLGEALGRVNLVDVETEEQAIRRVVERAAVTPPGQWIVGRGWDEGAWANRYPDKVLLSEAVPDHPVFLGSLHGFAGWANQRALDEAGITADTEVPVGGEVRLGPDGQPNGLFLNRAVPLVADAVPAPTHEELMEQVLTGLNQMAEDGYVAVHDAGLDAAMMAALEQLEAEGRLPIRVYAMLSLRDEPLMRRWIDKGPDGDTDSMLVTRTVKAYYDGALGSRGARLLYDYSDRPGHRGISGSGYGFDEALMAEAMKKGFQVAIHAIGDAGNRESIDILQRVFEEAPETQRNRHRIEHAQVIHPDDIPRLGRLGIIASMEPPHAVEDKTWAEERVGPERIKGAYAWRSLRKAGVDLTFNSDNPGSDHNIFYGLHSAVTRQDKNLQPEGGWYPEEAVTADEAVRGYTSWSAYASFRENDTGVLDVGRWADVTVMDIDPFVLAEESPSGILQGRILMTIVDGKVVYER
ncbi:MAG: amidohydrolase [Gammaproteobacteria bacterium]|nr:amidohydrolase [Gammaproteobacteria bacterium]MDH5310607.1 amidohydrolase [Gammaproteobacteria bacterium]